MARALVLAERGRTTVRPNPMVGCVIVAGGEIVGEGWHERAGGPHAEIVALDAAGDRATDATLYVNLEPCRHHGRTGPCTRALIEAQVGRVVYAMRDPDPQARGGHEELAAAGIAVEGGVLGPWAEVQNEVFLHVRRTGRPHVTLKLAQTLDGELSLGDRRYLTGEQARTVVHRRRAHADGVLVGVGTVLADDPRLDVRHVDPPSSAPRAIVLDSQGRTPLDAEVVRAGTVVVTTSVAPAGWRGQLADQGVEVLVAEADAEGRPELGAALRLLVGRGFEAILAEPGATLTSALVRARLVDRLVLHIAVTLVGPHGIPRLAPAVQPPAGAGWEWRAERTGYRGPDLELVATPVERSD